MNISCVTAIYSFSIVLIFIRQNILSKHFYLLCLNMPHMASLHLSAFPSSGTYGPTWAIALTPRARVNKKGIKLLCVCKVCIYDKVQGVKPKDGVAGNLLSPSCFFKSCHVAKNHREGRGSG